MNTVQFDPKIATDLQIDGRRHASAQNSDLFADLLSDRLKRPIDADRPDRHASRSHAAPDTLSGRPPRLVIAHARTIRGEAKEIEDPADRRLPDHTDCAQDKSGAEVVEEPTETADAEPAAPAAEAEADTDAGVPDDQTAEATTDQSEAGPMATIVVAVQPATEKATDNPLEMSALLPVPAPAEGQGVAPEQPENAKNAAADGSEANTDGAAEAAAALAEAGLSELAATLIDGETAPAGEQAPVLALSPETAAPIQADAGEAPLLQMPEAPTPVAEIAAAQPQPARPAMDIKLRPGGTTRAHAAAPDPAPSSSATSQSVQPHQATLPHSGAAGEFGAAGDAFDQPLSTDGSGSGWAFHLAQGAGGQARRLPRPVAPAPAEFAGPRAGRGPYPARRPRRNRQVLHPAIPGRAWQHPREAGNR